DGPKHPGFEGIYAMKMVQLRDNAPSWASSSI
ncbi:hypothetical protein ABIB68_004465, partial [Bradyrhizobium sp. F1.2.2]